MKRRVFLAFPVPLDIRQYLAKIAQNLSRRLPPEIKVRWAGEEGMHLTLHFLGNQSLETIEKIKSAAASVASGYRSVEVSLGHLTSFPENGPSRVIIAGIREDDGLVLRQLQSALGRELRKLGIITDGRVWTPHLTLGRVKHGKLNKITGPNLESMKFRIERLELIESQLSNSGAFYSPLASFPLQS